MDSKLLDKLYFFVVDSKLYYHFYYRYTAKHKNQLKRITLDSIKRLLRTPISDDSKANLITNLIHKNQ